MRRTLCWIIVGTAALAAPSLARAAEPPKFEWKDGDRVVLIGDTLIEQDQRFSYFETLVTAQNPDKSITFRNLGWSGDTVFGHARAGFGTPADGFKALKEGVLGLKPTVLIVAYGMAESFDGDAGLPRFVSGLNTLLDTLAPTNARLVLLSPIYHEDLGRPLPDPSKHNKDLAKYRDAIKTVADERKAWFVDLYKATTPTDPTDPRHLTDNGIHPTAFGHWRLALLLDAGLGSINPLASREVRIETDPLKATTQWAKVTDLKGSHEGVSFTALDRYLPFSRPPKNAPGILSWLGSSGKLSVKGLAPGRYTLKIDDQPVTTVTDKEWAAGVALVADPEARQAAALNKAIVEKNLLYFYRWRPQNETYLFGFRKHEQGNNAREIPQFDPLVEAKEKEIAVLKKPVPHVYLLTRENEVAK